MNASASKISRRSSTVAFMALWVVTFPSALACAAPLQMYWTDNSGVLTAKTSDLVVHDVVTGVQSTKGIDVVGGYAYWTTISQHQVLKTPVGGGPSTVLYQGSSTSRPNDVAVDELAGKIYWTDDAARTISRANLDGSNAEVIVNTNTFNPPGSITIDLDAQRIYWGAYPGGIFSSNVDGSDVQSVVSLGASSSVADIVLDTAAQKMYWTDFRLSSISRSNLDGSDVEKIHQFATFTDPKGIDLDLAASKLYWVTGAGRNIQRSNLDGSDLETVLDGLVDPLLLRIVPVPEPGSAVIAALGFVIIAILRLTRPRRTAIG